MIKLAYDSSKPANNGFLAEFPPEMREQLRAIINDQIVDAMKVMGLSPGNVSGNIPVSNGVKCVNLNAELHGGNLPSAYAASGHSHPVATGSSNGFLSNTDKAKLDTLPAGAEVNQNAFSNVQVGTTILQSDSKTDTLELIPGANITLTPDAANDRITFAVSGKVPSAASADTAATASACTGNAASASSLNGFSLTGRSSADVNTYLSSGMFALNSTPPNSPPFSYCSGISVNNSDVGLQIAGGYTSDNLYFRGWWSYGAGFSDWRTIIHSGNIGSQSVNYAASAGYARANGGTADTATKAIQDASGNIITSTYATTANPTFTGTVTAPTMTVTTALNIPGGKLWII